MGYTNEIASDVIDESTSTTQTPSTICDCVFKPYPRSSRLKKFQILHNIQSHEFAPPLINEPLKRKPSCLYSIRRS